MRLYYYTPPEHAVENVHRRRIKVSFPDEVNDVFEMSPFDFGEDGKHRKSWKQSIRDQAKKSGFISFSTNWQSPTMWAHYARNNTGVCYGFDLDPSKLTRVGYVEHFRKLTAAEQIDLGDDKTLIDYAMATKSVHWAYEEEWRMWVDLSGEEIYAKSTGKSLFFLPFSETLKLKEIIIGSESKLSSAEFRSALGDASTHCLIHTGRPSFRGFKIVKQMRKDLQK